MADCADFQAQIASIIEILANSAVLEICRLVEDGYTALRARMEEERSRGKEEKEALRSRLEEMELKIRGYERRMKRRGSQLRMSGGPDDHPFLVHSPSDTSVHKPSHHTIKVKQEVEERDDCNLDLKVEVNIRADCGISSAMESNIEDPHADAVPDTIETNFPSSASQSSSSPTNAQVALSSLPQGDHKSFKPLSGNVTGINVEVQSPQAAARNLPDIQTDVTTKEELPPPQLLAPVTSDEPDMERLNSMDLAWMQERVSHLGATYAVTQLGLGNTESGHPSNSFPSQGVDSLDSPPTMVFTGNAHEMAAFAASFEMAAAASHTNPSSPRQPYRSGVPAKEPLVCSVCRRIFPSPSALELHQRVHSGERPYTCPHCKKGFAQPNNLRVHLLIHTGERRYRCTLCGKSFISSSHLKRHRTVHTQEKPYTCSRCGQSFSQMCSVRRHRQQSQCGL